MKRTFINVNDVLHLFPERKKSWAYKQLQTVRDSRGTLRATLRDFAEHCGLTESELREMLSTPQ